MGIWRDLFQDALTARDDPDLEQRIKHALQAIDKRIRESGPPIIRVREEKELCEAVQTLKLLRLTLEESKRKAG